MTLIPGNFMLDALPDPLWIHPVARRAGEAAPSVRVAPPGSKSLTNRALLLAALADGESRLRRPLIEADDTRRMLEAIRTLGADVTISENPGEPEIRITGVAGRWRTRGATPLLQLGNAGTATRFLAASALLADGPLTIDGDDRMRERPIGELVVALEALGASIHYGMSKGCPPLTITPPTPALVAPTLSFGRTRSSQYLSAVAMLGPWTAGGVTLRFEEPPTSGAYLRMTLELLDQLGASVRTGAGQRVVRVGPGGESPGLDAFELTIEPDASGATYFWGAAALVEGMDARVLGLTDQSIQSDAEFPGFLARMGATVGSIGGDLVVRGKGRLKPILADMGDTPDAAVTLIVLCAFADGVSVLRGVRTLRDKECDRIAALQTELAKIGVVVEQSSTQDPDTITITPPPGGVLCDAGVTPVIFDTYRDHRMAMALSLIGLRRPGVGIRDPGCVAKTYPGYWRDFAASGAISLCETAAPPAHP